MPSPTEVFQRYFRPRRATSAIPPLREAVKSVGAEPERSAWDELMRYIDLPGAAVRNVLSGNLGGAAQSAGAFLLPGIIDKPEDQPDFGPLGNIATDPFVWFTGGGAGAARAVAGATRGLRGATAARVAARALKGSTTKAGKKALKGVLDIISRPTGVRVGRTAEEARRAASLARELRGVTKIGRVAEEAAQSVGKAGGLMAESAFLKGLTRRGLLDKGGLKIGVPFREGKTIAFAGKDVNLLKGTPYYWVARGIGRAAKSFSPRLARGVQKGLRSLGDKLYLGRSWNEAERGLATARNASVRNMIQEGQQEIIGTFRGFDREALQDFTQTLARRDFRGSGVVDAASFKEAHPHLSDLYDDALARYKTGMDRMKEDLVSRGLWSEEVPEHIVQARHARAFPDEADAIRKYNKSLGPDDTPAKFGDDLEIPVLRKTRIERFKTKARARAAADALKDQHPDLASRISVRKLPTRSGLKASRPWEVLIREGEEIVNLSTPKLHENLAYFPQQYTDDVLEAMEQANWERELVGLRHEFGVRRGTGATVQRGPRSVPSVFERTRKYDQEDFLEHVQGIVNRAGGKTKNLEELDIARLWAKRLQAHARRVGSHDMLQKARRFFGSRLERISQPFHDWLEAGAGKLTERTGFWKAIDFWNRKAFKPFVTVGIGPLPNPAFNIRNAGSGVWQAAAHVDIGTASGLRHLAQIVMDGAAEIVERLPGIGKVPRNQLGRILKGEVTDDLVRVGREVLPYTERQVAELLRKHGITRHNFFTTEIADALAPLAAKAKASSAEKVPGKVWRWLTGTEFPGRVTGFIEDRMRATGFIHALRKLDPEDAARATREAFIDYEVVSDLSRNLRDAIPFAQFDIGQTPRTIKTILERPRVLAPLAAAAPKGQDDTLVPPWIREQPHLRIGTDAEGNPVYGVGAMTPFENIGRFWAGNLGRTIEKNIGTTAPPLKFLYEQASGREPFFGGPIGAYRRDTPFAKLLPDALVGRTTRTVKDAKGKEVKVSEVSPAAHRVIGYSPLSRQIASYNKLFDERKSVWHRSIGLLTGVRTVSVDEDRELRSLIGRYLQDKVREGDVGTMQRFFALGDIDPDLAALIKAYHRKRQG